MSYPDCPGELRLLTFALLFSMLIWLLCGCAVFVIAILGNLIVSPTSLRLSRC